MKRQFKDTFGEDLYETKASGTGADAEHTGTDNSLFDRLFHVSHSQVDSNALN